MTAIWKSVTPPYDGSGRRHSSTAHYELHGERSPKTGSAVLSPPPTPRALRNPSRHQATFAQRLRSNSGLSLHMNEDALRQYTDYNPDGTSRHPLFSPVNWQHQAGDATSVGHRSSPASPDGHEWTLPIPDWFGWETFSMVLKDPVAADELHRFARETGCGNDVAYLLKVQEYSATVDHLAALLSTISSHHTSVTATAPIQLPCHVARSVSTDLKNVAGSILPGLDSLFIESRHCIEQRVYKEVYPAFVKHQLAAATTASLASSLPLPETEYSGLATAFCIVDAQGGDRIKYASDSFISLTGCTRGEVTQRDDPSFQALALDRDADARMYDAVTRREECTELVINRREDGDPFWNLIYLCPLPDSIGERGFYLHSHISVSDRIRTPSDMVRTLSCGSSRSDTSERSVERTTQHHRRASTPMDHNDDGPGPRGRDRDLSRSRSSRRIFKPFWKAADQPLLYPSRSDTALSATKTLGDSALPPLCEDNTLGEGGPGSRAEPPTAYSRFLLLRHRPGADSRPRLVVSHASSAALDLLNTGLTADEVQGRDVFAVLGDGHSITKSFKASVREGVLGEGKSVAVEFSVAGPSPARSRKGSVISLRGMEAVRKGSSVPVNSFWTPLGGEGRVDWVLLVLVPCRG